MPDQVKFELKNKKILFIIPLLVGGAIVFPNQTWDTILIAFGLFFAVCGGWTWLLSKHIQSERELTREWFSVGDRLIEQLAIHNSAWLPAVWLVFIDESNIPGYRNRVAYELPAQFSLHWRVMAACNQRGRYQLGPSTIITGDPFGLFETTIFFNQTQEIIIFPPTDVPVSLDFEIGRIEGPQNIQNQSLQLTDNLSTLRDYQPGDPLKWIHWPSTAHRGELIVREFERNIRGDVWIIIDGEAENQRGLGPDGTEEVSVLLAAAFAHHLFQKRRNLGLLAVGEVTHHLMPSANYNYWQLLYQLAVFRAAGLLPIDKLIQDHTADIKRGSNVIIITPNGSTQLIDAIAGLKNRNIFSTVFLFDQGSFGGEETVSISGLRSQIRQLEQSAIIVKAGDVVSPTYEEGKKDRFVTTPMGKVIELDRG